MMSCEGKNAIGTHRAGNQKSSSPPSKSPPPPTQDQPPSQTATTTSTSAPAHRSSILSGWSSCSAATPPTTATGAGEGRGSTASTASGKGEAGAASGGSGGASKPRRAASLPRKLMSLSRLSITMKTKESKYLPQLEAITLLSQEDALKLDQDLYGEYGFTVEQIMELAGLSVAMAIAKTYAPNAAENHASSVLICCGPGKNGAIGLVTGRHLKNFGFRPSIFYPKHGKSPIFRQLVKQCQEFEMPFLSYLPSEVQCMKDSYNLIVDAIFGFAFRPPVRPEFEDILRKMAQLGDNHGTPIVSIDIPSGWHVENGPPVDGTPIINPDTLISLIAPKQCAKFFNGRHHLLGGRFLPPSLATKYSLKLPAFASMDQVLVISTATPQ